MHIFRPRASYLRMRPTRHLLLPLRASRNQSSQFIFHCHYITLKVPRIAFYQTDFAVSIQLHDPLEPNFTKKSCRAGSQTGFELCMSVPSWSHMSKANAFPSHIFCRYLSEEYFLCMGSCLSSASLNDSSVESHYHVQLHTHRASV